MTQIKRAFVQGLSLATLTAMLGVAGQAESDSKPDALAAARFLEQASWGPTAATVAHVREVGFQSYMEEQFQAAPSPITVPPPDSNGKIPFRPVQDQFFFNAINGEDQLRQRVMFALNQIWVVSGLKITDPRAMVNYLQLLQKDAFANYYDVMHDITLSPAMGHYLDMVNNDRPNPKIGKGANENYAREIMQLFTIGLSELNPDGTLRTDSAGNPIPTYTQDTIEGFSRAFTGWTYAPAEGAPSHVHNPPNWTAPMVAWDSNHDIYAKTLLNGATLPANQTAEEDLQGALNDIFNHPNVGPFVCRQLIQHLVTSSPTPAYVGRVANVFSGDMLTRRGDLKAVIKAILLDPEARMGDLDSARPWARDAAEPRGEGHLREPVLLINALLRALGATVAPSNGLAPSGAALGQNIYFPPTVFNYFAPGYEIADTTINAPEFQILSTSTAMLRADFVNSLIYGKIAGVSVDLSPFIQAATDQDKTVNSAELLYLFDAALIGGRMPGGMRGVVERAMDAATTARGKAQAAIYLIATSWQYQVQR
ncbi:MAG TPA: DUF1800 domain-containing protein [Acidobacteriota bacterium]|nr:DUF1800 domain-containing protein [Acidobacteriota bacterium]